MKNNKLPDSHKHNQVIYLPGYQISAKTKSKSRKNISKITITLQGERAALVDEGQQAAKNSGLVTRQTLSPFGLFINNLD